MASVATPATSSAAARTSRLPRPLTRAHSEKPGKRDGLREQWRSLPRVDVRAPRGSVHREAVVVDFNALQQVCKVRYVDESAAANERSSSSSSESAGMGSRVAVVCEEEWVPTQLVFVRLEGYDPHFSPQLGDHVEVLREDEDGRVRLWACRVEEFYQADRIIVRYAEGRKEMVESQRLRPGVAREYASLKKASIPVPSWKQARLNEQQAFLVDFAAKLGVMFLDKPEDGMEALEVVGLRECVRKARPMFEQHWARGDQTDEVMHGSMPPSIGSPVDLNRTSPDRSVNRRLGAELPRQNFSRTRRSLFSQLRVSNDSQAERAADEKPRQAVGLQRTRSWTARRTTDSAGSFPSAEEIAAEKAALRNSQIQTQKQPKILRFAYRNSSRNQRAAVA